MGWWIVVLVSLMSSPNVVLAQGNKAKAGPETATPDGAQSQDVSTITPNPPPLGSLVHVRLTSGDGLRGILVAQARDTVVIELPSAGRIELQRSAITSLSLANRTRIGPEGQLYRRDPNRTRYLYGPSAFSLEAGEGYVSQKELLFTAVAYGVTDNITVLGGTILPAAFGGSFVGILGAKLGYELVDETLHLAAGGEMLAMGLSEMGGFGFFFGSATLGDVDRHLTVSVGRPFRFGAAEEAVGPLITTLSGAYRLSRRFAALTENWIMLPSADSDWLRLHGLAGRVILDSWALDIGGIWLSDFEFPLPWLDLTYNF